MAISGFVATLPISEDEHHTKPDDGLLFPVAGPIIGTMDEESARERAQELFQQAYQHQAKGELDRAVALYKESIAVFPTAEAYTFLGWTYSFMDRYDEAIAECLHAIEVDPDFGNPYNDIGSYLIQKGQLPDSEGATRRSYPLAGEGHARPPLRGSGLSLRQSGPPLRGQAAVSAGIAELQAGPGGAARLRRRSAGGRPPPGNDELDEGEAH